jgi:uncharacterized damage-inducible protein DinB
MRIQLALSVMLFSLAATAQSVAANPQVNSAKAFYGYMKTNVLKTAEKVPEEKYSFSATEDTRSIGQLLAHIADAQFAFCGIIQTGKAVTKDAEHTAKTKADIVKALNDSFALCDADWTAMTDANSADMVIFHGPVTKLALIGFNTAHSLEHYGNLVTNMRLCKIVPPTAEETPAPAAKASPK